MQGKHKVIYEGRAVGTVELIRQGLYYLVHCVCTVADGEIHRLYAEDEKLGVLIPEGDSLVLKTRVAAKRLKEGCTFSLDENAVEYIPIRKGEPFPRLEKVREGKLIFRDGEPCLLVK